MIGIMSDSHDNITAVRQAVSLFNSVGCELVLHAGDFVAPFSAKEFGCLACPVKAVFGNCDGEKKGLETILRPFGEIRPEPFSFRFREVHILLTHLPFSNSDHAEAGNHDILVFGHTHKPEIRRDKGTLLINPGETGGWVSGSKTVAVLNPADMDVEIISL